MESLDDSLVAEDPHLMRRPFFMSSSSVDEGTLVTSVATVVSTPLLECAADSKSGRRNNTSATTISRQGLYSTEKL